MTKRRESQDRIDAVRRRDPDALEVVVRENILPLTRAARSWGLDGDGASDAVQDTFLVFVEKAHQFDGRASVRTWLFGILFRKVAERRRALAREEAVDDVESVMDARFDATGRWLRPPDATDAGMAAAEIRTHLNACLNTVPTRLRTAFVLRDVEDLATADVCKILEVSANNLGVMLYRARNRLRECLEGKGIRGSVDAAV